MKDYYKETEDKKGCFYLSLCNLLLEKGDEETAKKVSKSIFDHYLFYK